MEIRKRQIQKMDEEIATQRAIRQAEEAKAAAARAEAERPPLAEPADISEEMPLTLGVLVSLATLVSAAIGFILGRWSKRAAVPARARLG